MNGIPDPFLVRSKCTEKKRRPTGAFLLRLKSEVPTLSIAVGEEGSVPFYSVSVPDRGW